MNRNEVDITRKPLFMQDVYSQLNVRRCNHSKAHLTTDESVHVSGA